MSSQFDELISNPDYSKLNFPYRNRYRYTTVYTEDNETFFGTYDIPEIPSSPFDEYHQIKPGEEGRWDLISNKHYSSVNYGWLICHANEIYDPFDSPPAGTILRIPSLDYLTQKDISS